MVRIKFKNGSYIETIQSTESYKRRKRAIGQWMYWRNKRVLNNERYWKQNPDKFFLRRILWIAFAPVSKDVSKIIVFKG